MSGPIIVLSPHLDDAVLSIGAQIARWASSGRRVEVWSLFTGLPTGTEVPRAWRVFGDYKTRRAEDRHALALLGAVPRHLGLPERLWRPPRPRTLAAVLRGPRTTAGFTRLDDVRNIVSAALATAGAEVYAPLGVGGHHDHLEVAVAALTTACATGRTDRIRFYEDYYAVAEGMRRRHPVTRSAPMARSASPGPREPRLATGLALMGLFSRSRNLDRYVGDAGAFPWRWDAHPVDGFEPQKLAAVLAYRNQARALGGRRSIESVLCRTHTVRGGELTWRFTAPSSTSASRAD